VLDEDKIDTSKHLVFSCGGGITACINETAARIAGATKTSIYDGSFQEYSQKGKPDFL
jgi:thiosulfate/3-mercaptopyruvate sulfurtransferase